VAPTLLAADPLTAPWTPASYLQLYLAYAEAVSAGDAARALALLDRLPQPADAGASPRREPRTALERAVWEELRELVGDRVEVGVGAGGFRIDLAVRHADPAKGYAIGVECDGGPYFRDRSARNRDAWRGEVLARLGWKLHRVWSSSWWDNRTREVQRLRQALLLA
jgi:very-short-patch-repair endonuclease